MITTPEEYLDKLYQLQNNNFPTTAILLPSDEKIYNIDLNTRVIEVPEFLSVEKDHYAETIYFKTARYFDNMDLTNTVCVIQFENENAKNEEGEPAGGFYYPVPFYDVQHFKETDEILFPWSISSEATAASGPITFSIRFYKLNINGEYFIYNLNTKPATSEILHGMHDVFSNDNQNVFVPKTEVEKINQSISEIKTQAQLTWIDMFY